jgi:hypothetical protein
MGDVNGCLALRESIDISCTELGGRMVELPQEAPVARRAESK